MAEVPAGLARPVRPPANSPKKVNRELLLRRQLKPILPDFDVVLIDTPPAMRAATVDCRSDARGIAATSRRTPYRARYLSVFCAYPAVETDSHF